MTEVNFNAVKPSEGYHQVVKDATEGSNQIESGTGKILGSVWDTTTDIVDAVGDGIVGVAEGAFDVGVGATKYAVGIVKAPFAAVKSLMNLAKEKLAKSEENPPQSTEDSSKTILKHVAKGLLLEPAINALAGKKADESFHEPEPKPAPTPTPDPTPEIPTPCDTVVNDPGKLVIE